MIDLFATLHRTQTHGTVDLRRTYATSIDDLWDALTSPERLARWFAPVTGDLNVGGEVTAMNSLVRCSLPHGSPR